MKKPNYGQQMKMQRLDPVALAAYCKENDFALPQTTVPIGGLVAEPKAPEPAPEVVLTPVSDHVAELPPSTTEAPLDLSVVLTEAIEAEKKSGARMALEQAARLFYALKSRLEQNAAHSVLNWDEMADLDATLLPFKEVEPEAVPVVPKSPDLPPGQKWAIIVGEPMNRTQKFIRFLDDEKDAPFKVLFVNMSAARMMGRKVRTIQNPNQNQGGYILA